MPKVVGASTSKSPVKPPTEGSSTSSVHVNDSKPTTSIQIRLADGSRWVLTGIRETKNSVHNTLGIDH